MEFKYGDQAKEAGCYIASAAGFDSLPADLGTVLMQRQFTAPAVPSSVEAYLHIKSGPLGYKIHYATWCVDLHDLQCTGMSMHLMITRYLGAALVWLLVRRT